MKHRTTIGLDLAKNVIQVCEVSEHGGILINKAMSPDKVKAFLVNSKPCIVAMEGCGSFHYWARLAQSFAIK